MPHRRHLLSLLLATLIATPALISCRTNTDAAPATAAATHPSDTQKIESLIAAVANLTDAKFIRKGAEYDTANAVKFLRGKWSLYASDIKTVHDFIRICSAGSAGTGTPYYVRQNGHDTPAKDFFATELNRLEKK